MTLNKTILTIILLLSGLSLHAQVENAGGVRKRSEKEKKGVQGGPVISDRMQGFFEALVCEDGFDEAMFDEDLLNEENWFVRENGNSKGISCPAIYDNCQIGFRYR